MDVVKAAISFGLVLALATAACSKNPTSPSSSTPTTPTTSPVTESFSGTLAVAGASFYSFSMASAGTVTATLLAIQGTGVPPAVQVNLGVGTPSGKTCTVTSPTVVQIGGTATANITNQVPGVYCVNLSDGGNLFAPAAFTVSIDHP